MDAHALLTAQGWRGKGHSLHPTSDSTGLTHHILVKRNQDGAGLGSKKDHKQEAWWLNAFDQALKGIDMKSGTMKQTLKGGALEKITARNAATKYTGVRGLYSSFVRGGVIEGSLNSEENAAAPSLPTPPESGAGTPLATEPADLKARKVDKREETKEERRARKEAKKLREAEKEAQREAQRRAAEKVEKKKAKKAERQAAKEKLKANETREERRARRDARRKQKEEKRRLRAATG
jgi:nucleolar protein TMA23